MKNKVTAFIERGENGIYSIYIDLNDNTLNYGVHGAGETVKEAITDFELSYNDLKNIHKEMNKEFVEAEFDFRYDVASFLQYYSKIISLAGLERLTGVNQGQLSHYVNGHRKPSKKTTEKIQNKLHEFGKELTHLELA